MCNCPDFRTAVLLLISKILTENGVELRKGLTNETVLFAMQKGINDALPSRLTRKYYDAPEHGSTLRSGMSEDGTFVYKDFRKEDGTALTDWISTQTLRRFIKFLKGTRPTPGSENKQNVIFIYLGFHSAAHARRELCNPDT